jgi:hypothetical protein
MWIEIAPGGNHDRPVLVEDQLKIIRLAIKKAMSLASW